MREAVFDWDIRKIRDGAFSIYARHTGTEDEIVPSAALLIRIVVIHPG
jgi:hypothetical protein